MGYTRPKQGQGTGGRTQPVEGNDSVVRGQMNDYSRGWNRGSKDKISTGTNKRGFTMPQRDRSKRVFPDGSPATTPISNKRSPQQQAVQNLQKKYAARRTV
jgi:hypothetical protein